MHKLSEEALSGPGFAGQDYGNWVVCHLSYEREHTAHRWAFPDDLGKRPIPAHLLGNVLEPTH
jgi:hypothetical protein